MLTMLRACAVLKHLLCIFCTHACTTITIDWWGCTELWPSLADSVTPPPTCD